MQGQMMAMRAELIQMQREQSQRSMAHQRQAEKAKNLSLLIEIFRDSILRSSLVLLVD
jgi:hypothetical protein